MNNDLYFLLQHTSNKQGTGDTIMGTIFQCDVAKYVHIKVEKEMRKQSCSRRGLTRYNSRK